MSSTGKPLQFISSLLLFSSFSLFSCKRCWVWKHSVECNTYTHAGKGTNLSYKRIFIVQNTALILLARPLCYGVVVEAVAGAEPWHAHTELELPGAHRIWGSTSLWSRSHQVAFVPGGLWPGHSWQPPLPLWCEGRVVFGSQRPMHFKLGNCGTRCLWQSYNLLCFSWKLSFSEVRED